MGGLGNISNLHDNLVRSQTKGNVLDLEPIIEYLANRRQHYVRSRLGLHADDTVGKQYYTGREDGLTEAIETLKGHI